MRRCACLAVLCAAHGFVPTSVSAETPRALVGRWAERTEWCRAPRADESPEVIDRRGIEHFAAACTSTAWKRAAARSWTATAQCREEGEAGSHARRYAFRLVSGTTLRYSVNGEAPATRVRCPG